jgi:hypothetical protein
MGKSPMNYILAENKEKKVILKRKRKPIAVEGCKKLEGTPASIRSLGKYNNRIILKEL